MSGKGLRLADYLGHALEAIERIERYTAGTGFDDFSQNVMVQDAVIRNLEIIGESSRNIERSDPDFLARHPDSRSTFRGKEFGVHACLPVNASTRALTWAMAASLTGP